MRPPGLASPCATKRRARPEHGRVDRPAAGRSRCSPARSAALAGVALPGPRSRGRSAGGSSARSSSSGRLRAARRRASSSLAYGDELGGAGRRDRAADPLRARDAGAAGRLPQLPRGRLRRGPRRDQGRALAHRRAGHRLRPRRRLPPRHARPPGADCSGDARPATATSSTGSTTRAAPPARARWLRGRGPRGLRGASGCRAITPTTGSRSSSGSARTAATDVRASSHHGYGPGWRPADGGRLHASPAAATRARSSPREFDRITTPRRLGLIPLEPIAEAEAGDRVRGHSAVAQAGLARPRVRGDGLRSASAAAGSTRRPAGAGCRPPLITSTFQRSPPFLRREVNTEAPDGEAARRRGVEAAGDRLAGRRGTTSPPTACSKPRHADVVDRRLRDGRRGRRSRRSAISFADPLKAPFSAPTFQPFVPARLDRNGTICGRPPSMLRPDQPPEIAVQTARAAGGGDAVSRGSRARLLGLGDRDRAEVGAVGVGVELAPGRGEVLGA